MFDREAVLAAVDLPGLADELLGPGRGSKRSPTWRCPNPGHRQTGRTPSVTVFVGRLGEQRWFCHGCGTGGTAVDLVMQVRGVTAREALGELAARIGVPDEPGRPRRRSARGLDDRGRSVLVPTYSSPRPVPEIEEYVAECAEVLWTPAGERVRRWLSQARRIPEDVLQVNRVGADLGRRRQRRPQGVPEVDAAAVLPLLVHGKACYAQLRVLNNYGAKYLGTSAELAESPRLGLYRPAPVSDSPKERPQVIVAEGIIDALSAAAAGYSAVALLGTKYAGAVTAIPLAQLPRPLVLAFDADSAGEQATDRLLQFLRARTDERTDAATTQQEASWRQRALNAEDQIRALRQDLAAERQLVADLLGQLREPDGTWIEHDRQRLQAENQQLLAERNQLLRDRGTLQRQRDAARANLAQRNQQQVTQLFPAGIRPS